jgi:hypothetical protein
MELCRVKPPAREFGLMTGAKKPGGAIMSVRGEGQRGRVCSAGDSVDKMRRVPGERERPC